MTINGTLSVTQNIAAPMNYKSSLIRFIYQCVYLYLDDHSQFLGKGENRGELEVFTAKDKKVCINGRCGFVSCIRAENIYFVDVILQQAVSQYAEYPQGPIFYLT